MRCMKLRPILALGLGALLAFPFPAVGAGQPSAGEPAEAYRVTIPDTGLSEDEQIVHLLNRLAHGPAPGDIERVKEMGIAAYIERQLHPETIPDPGIERRLARFETLRMTPFELLAAYPPPQILRGSERRLAPRLGMDPDAAGSMFPELERYERRREDNEADDDPVARERRRQQAMSPGERMERAMAGPARIVIELAQAKLLRAVYSERELQEVMTDFWFNHFNVFVGKGADRWLVGDYERRAIRSHALGRFRDLLGATARHPAMLFYLDNWLSTDPEADADPRQLRRLYARHLREQGSYPGELVVEIMRRRGFPTERIERFMRLRAARMEQDRGRRRGRFGRRGPDDPQRQLLQQRRRGLNENYARELLELHTLGVDGGYTQKDIVEVARCFTGWTLLPLPFGPQFLYVDEFHDKGTKVVLDQRIPNGGPRDGERVLDIVARHPATAHFISTKLARRFVSDAPPASLVEKMAGTFRQTDGDIRAVLATLFSSEEFWSPVAVKAKVKTPLEFVASAARATGAEVNDFPPALVLALRGLGQQPYAAQPPTGYDETADAWVSTGGLLNRMKLALGFASNRLPGVEVELPGDVRRAEGTEELVAAWSRRLLGRAPSDATRKTLAARLEAIDAPPAAPLAEVRARLALGWLLASPDFQRQ